jgi:subtilisin family serine protease
LRREFKINSIISDQKLRFFLICFPLLLFGTRLSNKTQLIRPSIKVAIIDTGADANHLFLKNQLWKNSGEMGIDINGKDKSMNGIDDDGNGFVDDLHGWNFASDIADILDEDGHGTHIAGVIKKEILKRTTSHNFEFMILKYYNSKKTGDFKNIQSFLDALRYAIDMGADVINISGGGYIKNKMEFELLKKAKERGLLVIAAAGNKKSKSRQDRNFYPAAYRLPNVYSIAATDSGGHLLKSSNLNILKNNYLVPGEKIYSSIPGNRYGFKTGSSQAAAVFAGVLVAEKIVNNTF